MVARSAADRPGRSADLCEHRRRRFRPGRRAPAETRDLVPHGPFDCPPALAEMLTEAIAKANEPTTNLRQQAHIAVGRRVFLTTSGTGPIMFQLAMSCVLIKLALFLLTHKNQADKSDKVELIAPLLERFTCRGETVPLY